MGRPRQRGAPCGGLPVILGLALLALASVLAWAVWLYTVLARVRRDLWAQTELLARLSAPPPPRVRVDRRRVPR